MRLAVHALAISAALAPGAASACSVFYQPFEKHVEQADGDVLAIYGRPQIEFAVQSEEKWAGTIDFSRIRCLKRPRGLRCPKQLRVAFDETAHNCEEVLSGRRVQDAYRLRYFMFRRIDGAWKLVFATRKRDR
jgi:hypothetical protein